MRVLAISPHLDDVALGCADLVLAHPGALVLTVSAGKPRRGPLTDWDRACGFSQGDDVVGARRKEDERAVRHLGATSQWLDFPDHQYHPQPPLSEVIAAIDGAVRRFDVVASPLGLGHEDHLLIAAACMKVARRHPEKRWHLYEDAIYRTTVDGTEERLARLRDEGFVLAPVHFAEAGPAKRRAIDEYASQVKGLGALLDDASRPERYWTVAAR